MPVATERLLNSTVIIDTYIYCWGRRRSGTCPRPQSGSFRRASSSRHAASATLSAASSALAASDFISRAAAAIPDMQVWQSYLLLLQRFELYCKLSVVMKTTYSAGSATYLSCDSLAEEGWRLRRLGGEAP